ncbi:MAG: hypothetical protein M1819_002997 [Sarea resinae]|nr:MAG: hypothetical protein M1819_002997 [Sarea resinae]
MAGVKRARNGDQVPATTGTMSTTGDSMKAPQTSASASSTSPFMPMFEHFRAELDEHHDRRERVIKASRDVTAASKKMIFAMQRARTLCTPLPPAISSALLPHQKTISQSLRSIAPDLRGINAYRYQRQVSGGLQEYIEAVTFEHYLRTGTLLEFETARAGVVAIMHDGGSGGGGGGEGVPHREEQPEAKADGGENMADADMIMDMDTKENAELAPTLQPEAVLTEADYLLGIFDLVGELMRFAITAMATSGSLPSSSSSTSSTITTTTTSPPSASPPLPATNPTNPTNTATTHTHDTRTILTDLHALRTHFLALDFTASSSSPLSRDVDRKADVMRACVDKVEMGAYGLVVRGSERPKGWMPDYEDGGAGGAGGDGY